MSLINNPRDLAKKLIDALDAARRSGRLVHEHELTEAAFEDAIAAEREECAKIADIYAEKAWAAQDIAADIRARGQKL